MSACRKEPSMFVTLHTYIRFFLYSAYKFDRVTMRFVSALLFLFRSRHFSNSAVIYILSNLLTVLEFLFLSFMLVIYSYYC